MDNKIINIIKEVPFVGEDGKDYIRVTKEILTPRKTYIKGTISGKYRGDKMFADYDKSDLYDFSVYEAEVLCNSIEDFSKNKPFVFPNDFKNIDNLKKIKGKVFPKNKLPEILPVIISANSKTFPINVLEPKLYEFEIIRKYHQTEGDEVFGMFNAFITGYVLDYEREEIEEIVEVVVIVTDFTPAQPKICESNGVETGKFEEHKNYIRKEYFCKHHPDKVWGIWERKVSGTIYPPTAETGCLNDFFSIIGFLIGLLFLIAIFPSLLYVGAFALIILLIGWLEPYLKWSFRIIGVFLLLAFIASLINSFTLRSRNHLPSPRVLNPPVYSPIIDSVSNKTIDKWITVNRKWQDYDNNEYQGKYQIRLSDLNNSHYYKNNLSLIPSTSQSYDKMIFSLKENDKNNITSVYKLFDSIGKGNKLDKIKFAKMIVTFVQNLPYSAVLENECDASLYNDKFTKYYLSNPNAICDPFERFGINTPVEFLVNQKGDCDTRTLLLYTILANYNYDVALLSSELYSHSIIGVNLPIDGIAYNYYNQRYVLWETTSISEPGIISIDNSNLNNWRISLKSK